MSWTGITRAGVIVTEATEAELHDRHGTPPLVWDGPSSAAERDPNVRRARLLADPTLATAEELPDLTAALVRAGRTDDLVVEIERRKRER